MQSSDPTIKPSPAWWGETTELFMNEPSGIGKREYTVRSQGGQVSLDWCRVNRAQSWAGYHLAQEGYWRSLGEART